MKKLILLFLLAMPFAAVCQEQDVRKVAVMDVVDVERNVKPGIKVMLRSILAEAISHAEGYEVYDRLHLEQIMKEQKFQRGGMVNDAQIKKLGELTGVAFLLVPEASYLDNKHIKITITASLINIESGKMEVANAFSDVDNFDAACNQLVAKLFGVQMPAGVVSTTASTATSTTTAPSYARAGDLTFTVGGITFKMVYVQGGTFQMGGTYEQGSDCDDDEQPHQVMLDNYYIGEYEVTQALWREVMGTSVYQQRDKSEFTGIYGVGDDYPMYYVNHDEAQEFCGYLNRRLRDRLQGKRFALPTEAQWEYAARGGTKSRHYKYAGSNNLAAVAYYSDNSGGGTHPAGMKQPNELGLYDMSGNVWEWCADWYGSYSRSPVSNPAGPSSGSNRVLRGGSWYNGPSYCRVSYRRRSTPGGWSNNRGFRLVLLP